MEMETSNKIEVLEKSLNSRFTPENLKPRIREEIEKLKSQGSSKGVKEAAKKYYSKREIKSVTVIRNGKQLTYKADDIFGGAHFIDKKEKGGTLESQAEYIPVSKVVHITTVDGDQLKPDNGFWVINDAAPIYEFGGLTEVMNESIADYEIRQLEKGGSLSEYDYPLNYSIGDNVRLVSQLNNDDEVFIIIKEYPRSAGATSYDLEHISGHETLRNILPKMFRHSPATAYQKNLVNKMQFSGVDASVIDESRFDTENKTYSWEVLNTPDVTGEGFTSEYAAYESLINFMKIRKLLHEFYWKTGFDDYEVIPNSEIEKYYGEELNKVQVLIYKGKLKEALNVIARNESVDAKDEKYFYSLFSAYIPKRKKAVDKPDGRSKNGNPIFQKAKEIRKKGEPWKQAVKRAAEILAK